MLLLGITGVRGSGKGAVAQFVQEWATENGLLAVDRGFADMLKWATARIFWPDISREDAIEWANVFKNEEGGAVVVCNLANEEPTKVISGREFFQHAGTEMGRELFGASFWAELLLPADEDARARNFSPDPIHIGTVSDLRFQNEAVRIIECGGEIWKIDRPGHEPDGHASEVPLEARFIDMTVTNDGDLLDLKQEVFDRCDNLQARGMIR
jgi:hypothetical protein